jgi:hypothetical protein
LLNTHTCVWQIRLHNLQQYKILSKTIDMRSLIKLQVRIKAL